MKVAVSKDAMMIHCVCTRVKCVCINVMKCKYVFKKERKDLTSNANPITKKNDIDGFHLIPFFFFFFFLSCFKVSDVYKELSTKLAQ